MTKRMLRAIEDPNMDILGHCTGRIVAGRGRPESQSDHEAVFTACRDNAVAVETTPGRSARTRHAIC
jgi:putative hydrolase